VRGFILGVLVTVLILVGGGYWFVNSGKLSMATTAPPLPMEKKVAGMALRASIGSARDQPNPLPFDDSDMLAGAKLYKNHCSACHGLPQQPQKAFTKAMFPPPPQLFVKDDMVTDDPQGETYWKVTHGIRLSGMPSFANLMSDTERWQVAMVVAHADELSPAVRAGFGN
jgi:thiosulfate dehydrogenase